MTDMYAKAFGEVSLAVFTTLTPSGVAAFILMAAVLAFTKMEAGERSRTSRFLIIPLVFALVGLVMSATHLGNPANALYTLTRAGTSPLSTEVVAAIAFLGIAGLYWLYSFMKKQNETLQRVWLIVAILAGLVLLFTISMAYSSDAIITWNTLHTPLSIWLTAFFGGPLIALLGLTAAKSPVMETGLPRTFALVSAVAFVLGLVNYVAYGVALGGIRNSYMTAMEMVPNFWIHVAIFAILGVVALLVAWRAALATNRNGVAPHAASALLVLLGIFAMRLVFYAAFMTEGLGI